MSCIERAGWFGGLLSEVKLCQSLSISGPSATSKPMLREDGLDALHRAAHRVQAAGGAAAAGQRDVERFGAQLDGEFLVGQLLAALGQRRLDGLLGHVDGGAARLLLVDRRAAAMPFISSVMRPDLPRNCALAFSRSAGALACGKGGAGVVDQGVQLVHGEFFVKENRKKGWSPFKRQPLCRGRRPPSEEASGLPCRIKQPAWP